MLCHWFFAEPKYLLAVAQWCADLDNGSNVPIIQHYEL